jgi:hypothetical protein
MEGDSEDNECSCYDVTPRDGDECRLQIPKQTIRFSTIKDVITI